MADSLLENFSEELADAVESAGRSVVQVNARRRLPASGIIWGADGAIVTADHVVERDEDISIGLSNGQTATARLLGRDAGSDLAVLKIDGAPDQAATLAPAGSVKIGHFVVALGRPAADGPMASFGVVSALGCNWRTARGGLIDGYIRADLTLYPGFSGGPLVDTQGRIAGLNSSHLAGNQSFAIPSSALTGIVQTLITEGRVRRAYLGVGSQPVRLPAAAREKLGLAQETGLMLLSVEPSSAADKGGLLIGDVLLAVNGQAIVDAEDLQRALGPETVEQPINLRVLRGGEPKELVVTPSARA